jgi:hypothetical protein
MALQCGTIAVFWESGDIDKTLETVDSKFENQNGSMQYLITYPVSIWEIVSLLIMVAFSCFCWGNLEKIGHRDLRSLPKAIFWPLFSGAIHGGAAMVLLVIATLFVGFVIRNGPLLVEVPTVLALRTWPIAILIAGIANFAFSAGIRSKEPIGNGVSIWSR